MIECPGQVVLILGAVIGGLTRFGFVPGALQFRRGLAESM